MAQQKTNRGFTIVELLIVIVVIAILAAITIVGFNGVQNRAKNSTAEAAASQVVTKAEAFNTVKSYYPAAAGDFSDTDVSEAALEGVDVGALDRDEPTRVQYTPCPSGATGTSATGGTVTFNTYPTGTDTKTVGTGC